MPLKRARLSALLLGGGAILGLIAVLIGASPVRARARPFLPASDGQVLEQLPRRWGSRETSGTALQEPEVSDPVQAELLAREEIRGYQRTSDPRYLGRAEARLAAFWDVADAPAPIVVRRAKLRASNHEFEPALVDLNLVLGRQPQDAQALFERATVATVLGRYQAARADCERLAPLVPELFAVGCRAAVQGVSGEAATATRELQAALGRASALSSTDVSWAESLLGELAVRRGDASEAERRFRRALSGAPDDAYTLSALGDLLLDQKRPAEVVALLSRFARIDGLLLRLTIAERLAGLPSAKEHVAELAERFADARLRGSNVHRREEARFELVLRDDAERALQLALENFAVQREPWDVRLVLEAARAAHEPKLARGVAQFVEASQLEDPTIQQLARALGNAPR
jgi:tetratricopeptide (TPR) repeat protein